MKKKVIMWFGMLLFSLILVGCEDIETTSSNNTQQESSEQTQSTSTKKKSKKKKSKKKTKKSSKKTTKKTSNSEKKKSSSKEKKVNKIYYDPDDENIKAVREECDSAYEDIIDVDRGRAFDSYFSTSTWISREDEEGEQYVEFVGVMPQAEESLSKDYTIKKGMQVHIFFEHVSALAIDFGWKLVEEGYVCDFNGKKRFLLDEVEFIEDAAYEYYIKKTGQGDLLYY